MHAYLEVPQVISKNTDNKTFESAIKVFVDLQQTPAQNSRPLSNNSSYYDLYHRLKGLSVMYQDSKSARASTQPSANKEQIIRLHSSQSSNRYKTVESPALLKRGLGPRSSLSPTKLVSPSLTQQLDHPAIAPSTPLCEEHHHHQENAPHQALQRTRSPRHRPRYSFKTRGGTLEHSRPPIMKQLAYKPYKEPKATSKKKTSASKKPPKPKTLSTTARTDKLAITRHLAYHHPTSTLNIGTLKANIKLAIPHQQNLQREVMEVIQSATSEAARVKREGQRLIGMYIEKLDGVEFDNITATDRDILRHLCQPVSMADVKDGDDIVVDEDDDDEISGLVEAKVGVDDDESDDDDSDLQQSSTTTRKNKDDKVQAPFIWGFLRVVYSGKRPRPSAMGNKVNAFIDRLVELGLYITLSADVDERNMPFTPTDLVRSVATQLKAELKRMYTHGTCEIRKKLKKAQDRGILEVNTSILIRDDVTAIENYVSLNKLLQRPRRISPMSSLEDPFVGFTERELSGFFMKSGGELRVALAKLASDEGVAPTIQDIQEWIGTKEPGFLVKRFIADIDPTNLTSRKRGKAGHRAAIKLESLQTLKSHVLELDAATFDPKNYAVKGYVSRGSILTDGFRVYLLAFKLRELQCVRYRRLPSNRLPDRITSTVGGTDYYLQEIRNVIKDDTDIERLWPNTSIKDIKILTLDAGQAFVVGAYAYLPSKNGAPSTSLDISVNFARPKDAEQDRSIHRNLAVNQKAVMQPVFRYRRWLNAEKSIISEMEPVPISEIESNLPPLRGPTSSVEKYLKKLQEVEERLSKFYNGKNRLFKKHTWDMNKAKHTEYQIIAERLLRIVGGTTGRHRDPDNHVIIGVGLGQFKSSSRLSSLHSSFLDFFIPL
ncbi:hypothetical protein EDD11_010015, partial [Mortierella claussenii]